jgi:energy-coupling factor transporter ATP-binding protein EcfA2
MKLKIRKFDPSTIKPGRIILILGRRGSGKSVVLRDLLYRTASRYDFGVAMSPTEEALVGFRGCMPEAWIYPGFQQDKLDDIVRMQRTQAHAGKTPKQLFMVLDDCMYDKRTLKSKTMRDLFFNGRHLGLNLIFAAQYLMDIGPEMRSQIDYVICTREVIIANRIKLWKYFFGCFETYDSFSEVLDKCTSNFGVMVMDNTRINAGDDPISNCVYWYRADLTVPTFRMGKEVYWRISEQYQKTRAEREEEKRRSKDAELRQANKAKRGPIVVDVVDEHGNQLPAGAASGGAGKATGGVVL